ncbi:hypothetical protein QUF61_09195 [Candidatus Venteria ishoeyi]|uniref:hypothetical protein n=1 Tax=Candidatus Venteria ishoeyi TaxID=1899563 RepID=UPI0025A62DA2|nr:hypothetical protein [Candidatus Venteria ishoeyi]MDM8546653.1 hypothetical protein [Candidatus Venteria ishoeyi]
MSWDFDYLLPPLDATSYPQIGHNNSLLEVGYTGANMPVRTVTPGRRLRIRVLAPPGTTYVAISGESNNWQGGAGNNPLQKPVVGGFDYDPGIYRIRPIQRPQDASNGNLYFSDLHPVTAALNEPLYGTGSPVYPALDEPRYLHFILYNPAGSLQLNFGSLKFSMLIGDANAYNTWRNARPWAGGGSTDVDGIIEAPIRREDDPDPAPSTSAVLLNHPERTQTATEFGLGVFMQGIRQVDGTQLKEGSSLSANLSIDPDPRDEGMQVSYLVLGAWLDPTNISSVNTAIWQQCVNGNWQNWNGATITPEQKINLSPITPYAGSQSLTTGQVNFNLGEIRRPQGAAGRPFALFLGYQATASGQTFVVLKGPSIFYII